MQKNYKKGGQMKYKIVLNPNDFKNYQSPDFHEGESYVLAEGKGWQARVTTCGDLEYQGQYTDDVISKYDTDAKLNKAIQDNEVVYNYNNWYEVEFFLDKDGHLHYLDIMADDCVVFSFDEAIEVFKDYMAYEKFVKELEELIKKGE